MPNPRTWRSSPEVCSVAWRPDGLVATAAGFFSVSNGPGFGFTVTGSTVFGSTFFFLFLLRETAVRWEHIREIGGCCLCCVPTVDNKHKHGTGTVSEAHLQGLSLGFTSRQGREARSGWSTDRQISLCAAGLQRQRGTLYHPNSRALNTGNHQTITASWLWWKERVKSDGKIWLRESCDMLE